MKDGQSDDMTVFLCFWKAINFNIFNFPLHFNMLKHRLQVMETKKSVSDFQFEYGEFQLQYG